MSFIPDIQAFCCHYTSQQSCAENHGGLQEDGFPENITINRLTCSGMIKVSALLQAFENGADGVYVAGCPKDECHNIMGSQRAAKKVSAVKKALVELGVEPERIEMYHLERGLSPQFIAAGQEMEARIKELGPSPFKGEKK
ncbi:hydrogenase iron-sulfur subunit [Desulfobacterota bacterium M19]